jgi:hypothetical protein
MTRFSKKQAPEPKENNDIVEDPIRHMVPDGGMVYVYFFLIAMQQHNSCIP